MRVLLAQLPIPPAAIEPVRGNVPLAAGYLKMFAEAGGADRKATIDILPPLIANTRSDEGLVASILEGEPDLVGFTCYLWNITRTLHVATRLRQERPALRIIVGGPEITGDNQWVLQHPAVDFAAIGEGEQTFADLLDALGGNARAPVPTTIPGLWVRGVSSEPPVFRKPLDTLDPISSPYLEGILDAADEEMLLLETIRGCIFKCKFCYYPKAYDGLHFLREDLIRANLQHARERGARDVVLLDPTLNQRSHFAEFVELLADGNRDRQFEYFGELRAEGIKPDVAKRLREANFTEVEIGLQSVDGTAQRLMDRRNNMKAFERGVEALLDAGIRVKIDLIIGLPGDTPETVREGIAYLKESGLYTTVQAFQLSVLPGTAFRREAEDLQLKYQPEPPYYVTRTPAFELRDMIGLMMEVQEEFGVEFDQLPPPVVNGLRYDQFWYLPDDSGDCVPDSSPAGRTHAFTLWLRSGNFAGSLRQANEAVTTLLRDNPHSTLQVVIQPDGRDSWRHVTPHSLDELRRSFYEQPSYLDRFYAFQPGRTFGAKRIVLVLPEEARIVGHLDELADRADIVWQPAGERPIRPYDPADPAASNTAPVGT